MTEREKRNRLIYILQTAGVNLYTDSAAPEQIADCLLKNGVFMPAYENCSSEASETRPLENRIMDMYGVDINEYDEKEFIERFCHNCGSQRCEGIGTDWFDGCQYKNHLKKE